MTAQLSTPAVPIDMLVIEDDLVDELALTRAMQQRQPHYRLNVARSVAQARKLLEERRFDIILADYQLGDGNSFELMDVFEGQLVIFVTGSGDQDMAVRALEMGAHDFLLKDDSRGYLKLLPWRVDTALRHAHQADALKAAGAELLAREKVLELALAEKTALLNEVHHRVKNNLQIISSLLRMESRRADHTVGDTRGVLSDMQGRIRSMALLHESLYRSGNFAQLDLGAYLKQLCQQAFRALSVASGAVRLELHLASLSVPLEQATPAGLLVNELISNCLKHAFPEGRSGVVRVSLQPIPGDGGKWCLGVGDDGVGLAGDFATRRTQSLGLQLVDDLARQLNTALHVEANESPSGGTKFSIILSEKVCA